MDESLKYMRLIRIITLCLKWPIQTNSDQEIDVICDAVNIYPLKD